MKRSTLARAAALILTVVLLAVLFSQVDLSDVVATIAGVNPLYLVAGFLLYSCSYFFRALRFHILLNREVELRTLLPIVCVHNMVNSLLPARTGELSYVYLLKKVDGRTTGEGIATLVVARVFDCIAIAVLFLCSLSLISDLPNFIRDSLIMVVFAVFALVVVLGGLLYSGRSFLVAIHPLFQTSIMKKIGLRDFLLRKSDEIVDALGHVATTKSTSKVFILTLFIWISNYVVMYLLISGMNIALPLQVTILGGTFILLTTVLPIQGVGGFGTTESVWTLVFVPLGMSFDSALVSGFSYHIIVVGFYVVLGACGLAKLKYHP